MPSAVSMRPNLWRAGFGLAGSLLLFACATTGERSAAVATREENGFTIREEVSVSSTVRENFRSALELIEEGQYEDGIELLEDVTETAPTVTSAHIDLGIAYGMVGEFERAEQSIQTALKLNPRHPVAHNEMGIVFRKTGRFEEARASYETALRLHPDFHFARRNLAILCDVYLGDLECALQQYEAYNEVVPGDEDVSMWLTDLQRRSQK
jgi:Flp pilus assembly protein TadD